MSGIIYDARRLKLFEDIYALGEYAGRPKEWIDELWGMLLENTELMEEFMYYIDTHTVRDKVTCRGYGLADMYVFQMSRYNLIRDIGKNTESCNKESMVLGAFYDMAKMFKDPESYIKKLNEGPGMDRIY